MNNMRYRKHPRIYGKKQQSNAENTEEKTISLSGLAALGILAGVFVKGLFVGYILKKSMD